MIRQTELCHQHQKQNNERSIGGNVKTLKVYTLVLCLLLQSNESHGMGTTPLKRLFPYCVTAVVSGAVGCCIGWFSSGGKEEKVESLPHAVPTEQFRIENFRQLDLEGSAYLDNNPSIRRGGGADSPSVSRGRCARMEHCFVNVVDIIPSASPRQRCLEVRTSVGVDVPPRTNLPVRDTQGQEKSCLMVLEKSLQTSMNLSNALKSCCSTGNECEYAVALNRDESRILDSDSLVCLNRIVEHLANCGGLNLQQILTPNNFDKVLLAFSVYNSNASSLVSRITLCGDSSPVVKSTENGFSFKNSNVLCSESFLQGGFLRFKNSYNDVRLNFIQRLENWEEVNVDLGLGCSLFKKNAVYAGVGEPYSVFCAFNWSILDLLRNSGCLFLFGPERDSGGTVLPVAYCVAFGQEWMFWGDVLRCVNQKFVDATNLTEDDCFCITVQSGFISTRNGKQEISSNMKFSDVIEMSQCKEPSVNPLDTSVKSGSVFRTPVQKKIKKRFEITPKSLTDSEDERPIHTPKIQPHSSNKKLLISSDDSDDNE